MSDGIAADYGSLYVQHRAALSSSNGEDSTFWLRLDAQITENSRPLLIRKPLTPSFSGSSRQNSFKNFATCLCMDYLNYPRAIANRIIKCVACIDYPCQAGNLSRSRISDGTLRLEGLRSLDQTFLKGLFRIVLLMIP